MDEHQKLTGVLHLQPLLYVDVSDAVNAAHTLPFAHVTPPHCQSLWGPVSVRVIDSIPPGNSSQNLPAG